MESLAPIPFTDVPIEHKSGSYVCTRYGLLFEGHRCFGQLGIYLSETAPIYDDITIPVDDEINFADDTPSVQPARGVAEMPISWWRAQCAFRGLDTAGETENLQNRVTASMEIRMLDELISLEKDLMKDYSIARAAQRKSKAVRFEGNKASGGEGRLEGAEAPTGRRPRGGRRSGGRIPSRKQHKKSKPGFQEIMKRFGTKPL
jgi:hypothetical protein